jgi:hypothetical protein
MAWALEACVADYNTPGLFTEVTAHMRSAALNYTKENSLYRQWVDFAELRTGPADEDTSMYTMPAYEQFIEYLKRRNESTRVRLSDFKQGLKAVLPHIKFDNSTRRPNPNKAIIMGLALPNCMDSVGNVVQFPTPTPAPTSSTEEK